MIHIVLSSALALALVPGGTVQPVSTAGQPQADRLVGALEQNALPPRDAPYTPSDGSHSGSAGGGGNQTD